MNDKTNKKLDFLINAAYMVVIALILYLVFKYALAWIMPFIVAFCIVTLVQPLIKFINRKIKLKGGIVAIAVMLFVYIVLGGIIVIVIAKLFSLAKELFVFAPDYYNTTVYPSLEKFFEKGLSFIAGLPIEWQQAFNNLQATMTSSLKDFVGFISQKGVSLISSLTSNVPAILFAFVFTIMLSFFISLQYDQVVTFIKVQIPKKAMKIVSDTKIILVDTILKYVKAYLILMGITFVELSIGFIIIGVENAITLAAIISLFDALPFFGTGAIMVPWIIIEFVQGNMQFSLALLIVYGVITVVRNIIEPKIVGDQLGLNPIVSLMAIYLGYKIFGVLGMIIMPITVQIIIALQENGTIRLFKKSNNQNAD